MEDFAYKVLKEKTPQELNEQRFKLVDFFAKLTERKVELKYQKAEWWATHREQQNSDASTDREWERSKEGLELMMIREKIKVARIKIKALDDLLREKSFETKNQW